jgi:hypothetical protein
MFSVHGHPVPRLLSRLRLNSRQLSEIACSFVSAKSMMFTDLAHGYRLLAAAFLTG